MLSSITRDTFIPSEKGEESIAIGDFADLALTVEDDQTDEDLQEEESPEDPGVCRGKTVVLVDGATAAAEGDEEDGEAEEDEEGGDGDDGVVEEVKVLTVGHLGHNPGQYQDEAQDLNSSTSGFDVLVGNARSEADVVSESIWHNTVSISK